MKGEEMKIRVLKCPYCERLWRAKVENPVECPRCKRVFTDRKPEVILNTTVEE